MSRLKNPTVMLFLACFLPNIFFYLGGLLNGKTVFNFANEANTDGRGYYNIALDPFRDPPVDEGFRYATFLYPLLVSLIARGDPFSTAVAMEVINILAFSSSAAVFHQIAKMDGFPLAAVFYAFNPILLISMHGGMNEPLYFLLMFGGLFTLRKERFFPAAFLFSLAALSRPDFFIFALPYIALSKGKRFIPYLSIIFGILTIFGYYLISRFTLEHFIGFASGGDLPPQLGLPFATFLHNRFFGAANTFQITGINLILNEIIAWTIFAGILLSIYFAVTKRQIDGFSLSLIVFGSLIQPAYSYFSGYFRFISMVPSLYKIPSLLLKRRLLQVMSVIYSVMCFSILVAWFF